MKTFQSHSRKIAAVGMLWLILSFFSNQPSGWCGVENKSFRFQSAGFTQNYSDQMVFQIYQRIKNLWNQGLIFILELRGYHQIQKNIWEHREPNATYRFDKNTGEWTFIYRTDPSKPSKILDSPIMRILGTEELDFTGQPYQICFRFGGDGHSARSM